MLVYELFGYAKRAAVEVGSWFPTSGRTRFIAALEIARLSGGASITVTLEASPTGDTDSEAELVTFGAVAAAGETEKSAINGSAPDFTMTARDRYVRGRITAIAGDVTCRLRAWAPFLDVVAADLALLSQELRDYSEVERIIRQAETDVLGLITRPVRLGRAGSGVTFDVQADHDSNPFTPMVIAWGSALAAEDAAGTPTGLVVDADMRLPGFYEAMREEVVRQAEHRFRRHLLEQRSSDASAAVTLRSMPLLAPGLGGQLAGFRRATSTGWRGR